MKKILIVNKSFELGGIQSALANMLKVFSDTDVQIDLMVFNNSGENKKNIPDYVNILTPCLPVKTMGMTLRDALDTKNILIILFKVLSTYWSKLFNNTIPISFALMFQKKLTGYDYAVAYHHETSPHTTVTGFVQFILKKCDARTKIGWVHSDFKETGLNTEQNRKIYRQVDKIICVSKATMHSFTSCYPELAEKCDYCYNFLPIDKIKMMAEEKSCQELTRENDETIFFSACRLAKEKGIERTIDAMIPLWKNNLKFKWYIAGAGIEKDNIMNKIRENGLEEKVILLGYQENPYPYMKMCDWFLLSSYHETFSMVAAESIILGTPVLATDIPVAKELINNESGYICENSTEGIRRALKEIVLNKPIKPGVLNEEVAKTSMKMKGIFEIL